jgi:hypothetical protein
VSVKTTCDMCGTRIEDHAGMGHPYTCAADDALRALRKARFAGCAAEPVMGACVYPGCARDHDAGTKHDYRPPSAGVLLARMRERWADRILRRVNARGVWETTDVYHAYMEDSDADPFDGYGVNRLYADMSTAVRTSAERIGLSRFAAAVPHRGTRHWRLTNEREELTVIIERRAVGRLARPDREGTA